MFSVILDHHRQINRMIGAGGRQQRHSGLRYCGNDRPDRRRAADHHRIGQRAGQIGGADGVGQGSAGALARSQSRWAEADRAEFVIIGVEVGQGDIASVGNAVGVGDGLRQVAAGYVLSSQKLPRLFGEPCLIQD